MEKGIVILLKTELKYREGEQFLIPVKRPNTMWMECSVYMYLGCVGWCVEEVRPGWMFEME